MSEPKIEFGGRNRRLCRCDSRFCLRLLLNFVIKLASGNRTSFSQWGITVHIDLGESQLRLRLTELSLRLLKRGLKGTRIDFEEDLALLDLRTLAVILADQIPICLRLNLRIDVAIERANPFTGHRYIGLLSLDNRHLHWRWRAS